MPKALVTLDTFDPKSKARLNSPRSLEACRRQGIDPDELRFTTRAMIKKMHPGIDKKVLDLRFSHYEEKRAEKLRVLKEEREQVMRDEDDGRVAYDESSRMFKSVHHSGAGSFQANDSTILDREKKAMEAEARRAQKEVEQKMRLEKTQAER